MRKVLALAACLAVLLATLFSEPPRATAEHPLQDELVQRKAAAAEAKGQKATQPAEQDFDQLKADARARKGATTAPAADSQPEQPEQADADILAQSSKLRRGKAVVQEELVRSPELTQTFDSLREKALAAGTVLVVVRLRADFEPEGELPSTAAVSAQRSAIHAAQEKVLATVTPARRDSLKLFDAIPYVALEVDAAGVEALRSSPAVENIAEDWALQISLAESVPLIGAPAAWSAGFSGAGQTVAILDTGVDKNHPFLAGKVVSEACFSTNNSAQSFSSFCPGGVTQSTSPGSGMPCDVPNQCLHGTHVAGIAAGRGTSFSGVARDANIIAIQVFTKVNDPAQCHGAATCTTALSSDIAMGLKRVFDLRGTFNIASVNLSLGDPRTHYSSACDSDPNLNMDPSLGMLFSSIADLKSVGIATVIASGNEGSKTGISFPACLSNAISVGSTDDGSSNPDMPFSNTTADAPSDFSNSASILNLLAPGQWINSSIPGGGFRNESGTSMAAPHVTGAWAVLKSKSPSATVQQVYTALRDTGRLVTDINGVTKPRIRVDAALNALGGSGGGSCGAPTPMGIGQTVNGSLSETDCRYPAGGDHFSDAYTFSGTAGQQVAVSMSSAAFDAFIYLLGPNGAQLASNDDGGGGTNSRIPPTSGFFTLPSTGTYTIQATSFSSNTSGAYTLSLTAQTPDGCSTITPLSFGQTVSGTLSNTDCRLSDGSFFDKYSFSGTVGQQVSVSMSSTAFDTFLILLKPDGTVLAQDDDGGGGTNSRIPPTSGTVTLPLTGTYTILANSFGANVTGAYSLTLTGQTPGGGCPSTGISVGQTVSGTLSTTDCRLSDGSFFDSYTFSGTANQQISVSMSSATFDTYLLLLKPDGTLLAEDDDGGGNLNSRVPPGSGTVTLPVPGTYKILANSFAPNVTGGYTLTLSGSAPVSCASSPITFGQTVSGTLSTTDCRLSDGSFFDSYTFNGAAGQQVAVSMNSLAFDTFLFLTGPNGLVVDDDDGGGNLNSRIPPGTGFFTLPSSGTYTILANSFAPGVTGAYSLSLISSQAGCSYSISSQSASFGAGGGTGSVGVTAGAGCGWTAVRNAAWLTVTAGASGSGSGMVNFSVAANNSPDARAGTLTVAGQTFTVSQAANTNSTVQLSAPAFTVSESDRKVTISVTRTGFTGAPASVDYATADGTADRRKDYTQTLGTLNFGVGETTKTVAVFVTDDAFVEPAETFTFTLSNASGTTLGSPGTATVTINSNDATAGPNPVGDATFNPDFFVRQHYIDFLNREADTSGLQFWTSGITNCGSDTGCVAAKRVDTSAAFFLSIEFQNTGYLVYRFYKAAYGDTTSPNVAGTVPVIRLTEFMYDTQRVGQNVVVGQGAWQQQLEANKQAYALEFVQRQRFTAAFPAAMTPAQFVDKINQNTNGALSQAQRDQLVAVLTGNNTSAGRASVLRSVAEDADLQQREFNRAFVLMQYYGYLRRNPDDAPDSDFRGWKFWLDKLNQFNGDFNKAEMVKAFITSTEYRQRFGP